MSRRTSIGSVNTLPYFPLPVLWGLRGKLLVGDTQTPVDYVKERCAPIMPFLVEIWPKVWYNKQQQFI